MTFFEGQPFAQAVLTEKGAEELSVHEQLIAEGGRPSLEALLAIASKNPDYQQSLKLTYQDKYAAKRSWGDDIRLAKLFLQSLRPSSRKSNVLA